MITINNVQISEEELVRLVKDNKELMDKITQKDVWPKIGDKYYYFDHCSTIGSGLYFNDRVDEYQKETGNMFKTKEEAAQALDRQKAKVRIINRIKELNDSVGWVCDWSNDSQEKGHLYYSYDKKIIDWYREYTDQDNPTEFYFSADVADQVVKDCGEDYKIYLGVLQLISVK